MITIQAAKEKLQIILNDLSKYENGAFVILSDDGGEEMNEINYAIVSEDEVEGEN